MMIPSSASIAIPSSVINHMLQTTNLYKSKNVKKNLRKSATLSIRKLLSRKPSENVTNPSSAKAKDLRYAELQIPSYAKPS